MDAKFRERFQFHFRHGDCVVGERAVCAFNAARAEEEAERRGIEFRWQARPQFDHTVEWCGAYLDGELLASAPSGIDADADNQRSVAADVALEALELLKVRERIRELEKYAAPRPGTYPGVDFVI